MISQINYLRLDKEEDEIIEAFNQAITATKKVDAETKAGKPLPGQPINK